MPGNLRQYDVTIGAHRTTMLLDEVDAAAMGDNATLATPRTTAPTAPELLVGGKARLGTQNKARPADGQTQSVHGTREGAQ